jgi:hypothetical protein
MFLCPNALLVVLGRGLHAAGIAAANDDAEIGARLSRSALCAPRPIHAVITARH